MGQATRPEVHDVLGAKQFVLLDRDENDRGMFYTQTDSAIPDLIDSEGRAIVSLYGGRGGSAGLLVGYGEGCPSVAQLYRSDRKAFASVRGKSPCGNTDDGELSSGADGGRGGD
jgi:hypothetical protein